MLLEHIHLAHIAKHHVTKDKQQYNAWQFCCAQKYFIWKYCSWTRLKKLIAYWNITCPKCECVYATCSNYSNYSNGLSNSSNTNILRPLWLPEQHLVYPSTRKLSHCYSWFPHILMDGVTNTGQRLTTERVPAWQYRRPLPVRNRASWHLPHNEAVILIKWMLSLFFYLLAYIIYQEPVDDGFLDAGQVCNTV